MGKMKLNFATTYVFTFSFSLIHFGHREKRGGGRGERRKKERKKERKCTRAHVDTLFCQRSYPVSKTRDNFQGAEVRIFAGFHFYFPEDNPVAFYVISEILQYSIRIWHSFLLKAFGSPYNLYSYSWRIASPYISPDGAPSSNDVVHNNMESKVIQTPRLFAITENGVGLPYCLEDVFGESCCESQAVC